MEIQSDSVLVKSVLKGDRNAYGCLFERHERSVQAVALSILGDFHSAQDAVQESFITAYKKLGGLRNGSSFGPWIRKIAHRQALEIKRNIQKRTDAKEHTTKTAINDGEIDESNYELLEAVLQLPEHERIVVMLRYFDNHSTKHISEITGRPIGTVTMQLSRAHSRLYKLLKGTNHEK
ncbi:MAG: RNA polymerase sigma factor [Sedimentisphaerales bacterium]|nr:RNA polymerase sigma factor [Sedimentisphaerales bacterium]